MNRVWILLLIVQVLVLIGQVLYSRMFYTYMVRSGAGNLLVKISLDSRESCIGWIDRKEYYSCLRGRKGDFEFIEVYTGRKRSLIEVRTIRKIEEVKGYRNIVLGSL